MSESDDGSSLDDVIHDPGEIEDGQARRVSIARALAHLPAQLVSLTLWYLYGLL
jgi:hypothetical protein